MATHSALIDLPSKDYFDPDFMVRVSSMVTEEKTKRVTKKMNEKDVIIESPHNYADNTDIYIPVEVPGAIGYEIVFDSRSATESTYDFIKFFKDDSHTETWGDRYEGGRTRRNFPGTDERPPLVIPSTKFVFYFHSDYSGGDWGYRIVVTPTFAKPSGNSNLAKLLLSQASEDALSNPKLTCDVLRSELTFDDAIILDDPAWQDRSKVLSALNAAIVNVATRKYTVVDSSSEGLRVRKLPDLASEEVTFLPRGTIIETDQLVVIRASDNTDVPRVHLVDGRGWTSIHDGCGVFYLQENGNSPESFSHTDSTSSNEDYFKPKQLVAKSLKATLSSESASPLVPANAAIAICTSLKIVMGLDGHERGEALKRFCDSTVKMISAAVPVVPVFSADE